MGILNLFKRGDGSPGAVSVQTSGSAAHPYYRLGSYMPMGMGAGVYTQLRDAVPILDAALNKIVRLTEGFELVTGNEALDAELNGYFRRINVGGNQQGLSAFISNYLNQLLTYGTAIGEMVLGDGGIYALFNSDLRNLELRRAANGIDVEFYSDGKRLASPQLLLYSVLNPKPENLCGTSLLEGLPFVADILMKIYKTVGENWEHAGNVRYAVVCKSGEAGGLANADAQAQRIANAWSDAMSSDTVKDFVAVGDVSVKVIGADNVCLDSEIPVRQLLEQLVAKTGIPPFMLGLNWSSTERMSTQQADILTTELESYRRILTPVIEKIGNMYLALNGIPGDVGVVWDKITLQDECEEARAELYTAQAEKIRRESEN